MTSEQRAERAGELLEEAMKLTDRLFADGAEELADVHRKIEEAMESLGELEFDSRGRLAGLNLEEPGEAEGEYEDEEQYQQEEEEL